MYDSFPTTFNVAVLYEHLNHADFDVVCAQNSPAFPFVVVSRLVQATINNALMNSSVDHSGLFVLEAQAWSGTVSERVVPVAITSFNIASYVLKVHHSFLFVEFASNCRS